MVEDLMTLSLYAGCFLYRSELWGYQHSQGQLRVDERRIWIILQVTCKQSTVWTILP